GSDSLIFFFQAEDGIRDFHVTGVQTCALPIYAEPIEATASKRKATLKPVLRIGGIDMATEVKRAGLTVVITGTSSGIGKGVAQQLAAQGANVVVAARRTKEIEALADSCGPNAIAVTADVSREEDIAKLYEAEVD